MFTNYFLDTFAKKVQYFFVISMCVPNICS